MRYMKGEGGTKKKKKVGGGGGGMYFVFRCVDNGRVLSESHPLVFLLALVFSAPCSSDI